MYLKFQKQSVVFSRVFYICRYKKEKGAEKEKCTRMQNRKRGKTIGKRKSGKNFRFFQNDHK